MSTKCLNNLTKQAKQHNCADYKFIKADRGSGKEEKKRKNNGTKWMVRICSQSKKKRKEKKVDQFSSVF